ncbi:MAG TPA: hypothetical protein VE843_02730, partial [Ktedonobacteraceae bacterium]|nr:hypothetical protein [Ktedonobacteraceae bacterium]
MKGKTDYRFDNGHFPIWISLSLTVFLLFFTSAEAQSLTGPTELLRAAQINTLPVVRIVDHRGGQDKKQFPRFGQCQIWFGLKLGPKQTQIASEPNALKQKLYNCFEVAGAEDVNVLILPELAFALPDEMRREVMTEAMKLATQKKMIIIAGSYYDEQRYNRLVIVGENWSETGFKIRPSRFEVSPIAGEGMMPGESLLVLKTVYGTFAIITCVDLISDDVQYLIRQLATRSEIDVLINVNWNPAAWEFLVEANSIVRRHP